MNWSSVLGNVPTGCSNDNSNGDMSNKHCNTCQWGSGELQRSLQPSTNHELIDSSTLTQEQGMRLTGPSVKRGRLPICLTAEAWPSPVDLCKDPYRFRICHHRHLHNWVTIVKRSYSVTVIYHANLSLHAKVAVGIHGAHWGPMITTRVNWSSDPPVH